MNPDQHLLKKISDQLRRWAIESKTGGWSTHQVEPMRRLADEIDETLSITADRYPARGAWNDPWNPDS